MGSNTNLRGSDAICDEALAALPLKRNTSNLSKNTFDFCIPKPIKW
jgi:hypothetical protein